MTPGWMMGPRVLVAVEADDCGSVACQKEEKTNTGMKEFDTHVPKQPL